MPNLNFNALFDTLKNGVISLAGKTAKNYINQAKEDGLRLLDHMKNDLQTWAEQVKNGKMKIDELEDMVKGQVVTVELTSLKQVGIAEIEIDKFKNELVNLISETIGKII